MRAWATCLFILSVFTASPALANRSCTDVPQPVRTYLGSHPGWSLLKYDDSDLFDNSVWKNPEICPGWAAADLDGNGHTYQAMALIRRAGKEQFEKLVMLTPYGGEEILSKERKLGRATLIERGEPGSYTDFNASMLAGKYVPVRFRNDVFIEEDIDSSAWVYYRRNGKTRSLLNSN